MRPRARTRPAKLIALGAAALLLASAGCSKDKDAEPPAELVNLKPSIPVQRVWTAKVGGDAEVLRLGLGLAVDDGVVYAAGRNGEVVALDAATGRPRWTTKTKQAMAAGPGVGPNLVAVGTSDGAVLALDRASGRTLWQAQVGGEVLAAPVVAAGRVVVRTVDGRLRALDAASGKELWSAEENVPRLSLRGNAPPVVADEIVVAGFDSGKVVGYTLATGDVAWQAQVSTPRGRSELARLADVDGVIRTEGGDGYAVGYQGRLVMFALDSGQVWWGRDLSSYRGLEIDDANVYVATAEGTVVALRRRDGTVVWQQEGLRRRGLSAPAVVGDAVVVGDFDGYLHWLDRVSGQFVARERAGGARIGAQPVVAGDRVYVIDEGGRIAAYRTGGGAGR